MDRNVAFQLGDSDAISSHVIPSVVCSLVVTGTALAQEVGEVDESLWAEGELR